MVCTVNPYKQSALCLGHRQIEQILMGVFTGCLWDFLLKVE